MKLLILTVVLLEWSFSSLHGLHMGPSNGLYFNLNGVVFLSGDTVLITDIFADPNPGSSLVCNTINVNTHCCRGRDNPNGSSVGEWYFPNGTIVPRLSVSPNGDFTRTGYTHQVRLNRRNNTTAPLGTYTCVVPDMNNRMNHTASIILCIRPSTGLYFNLNGVVYLPGDTVLITDIGIDVVADPNPGFSLVCNTTNVNTHCCRGSDNPNGPSLGEWYFPNGTIVPHYGYSPNGDFARTAFTHQVRLNRRNNAMTPLGTYTCVVPYMNNTMNHTASITLGPTIPSSTGLYFNFNGVLYLPGDTVLITDIGTAYDGVPYPGSSLVCNTTNVNSHCCRGYNNPNGGPLGEWYFPDGTIVPRFSASPNGDFTRTAWIHEVRLNRRNNAMTPLGIYTCVVPDMNSTMNNTASITLDNIDECADTLTNNCDLNALCTNTVGSFTCTCYHGYTGDGITCIDINECANITTSNCDPNASCTNTPGNFTCSCNHGYRGNGILCYDIDECNSNSTNNCDPNALCMNIPGSFTCTCKKGYSGNGLSCDLVVICYGTSSCGGSFNVVTHDNCCTHGIGPVGLSFRTGEHEGCKPCPVVFGFNQTEFVGDERSQNYAIEIGFLSGSVPQEVKGSIKLTPVTAGIRDVRLLRGNIINIPPRSTDRQLITFALLMDAVAQEEDETFIISLNLNTPLSVLGNNSIIISKVKGTIIDTNVIVFIIPGCSYWAEEKPNAVMPVRILKSQSTFLANPVTLKLTPLTVAAAQSRGIIGDFPDDEISPNRAQEADFDGTMLEIIFPADENLSRSIIELPANIPIVDDEINEADVQQFIVGLQVFSALDTSKVKIEQNASICNIMDDDTLQIGFSQQSYDFQEPDYRTLFRNVTLIKENNRITEQTYSVAINVNSSGIGLQAATLQSVDGINYDYSIGPLGIEFSIIDFPPESQSITFPFFLNHDELPEGTETFQASAVANNEFPTFETPTNLFVNTLINIIDNDAVIVGFEQLQYTVNETIGTVEVCIIMTNPPPGESLIFETVIEYITVTGTADGADFTEIGGSQRINRFPMSSGSSEQRKVCSNVSIIDDDVYERDESFTLLLRPRLQSQSMFTLSIEPRITTITIIDEDDAVIGFIDAPYAANENGIAAIKIGVVSGRLQREVLVDFSVFSGSAVVGSDFSYSGPQAYTFDASTNVSIINIALVNDNVYELIETFQARLSFHGQQPERVRIDPGRTYATIFDDDVIIFNLNPVDNIINEYGGSQTVSVVLVGEFIQELSFIVTASTDGTNQAATAMSGVDYTAVSGTSLTFSSGASRIQSFEVPIVNDNITELEETMFVHLAPTAHVMKSRVQFSLSDHESARIMFGTVVGSVTIKDDDVATIGFDPVEYNVSEGAGAVELTFRVLQGELGFNVHVLLFTSQGSAIDGRDYIGSNATSFRLTSTESATVQLLIKDDNTLEAQDTENFFGIIRYASTPFPNVRFNPARAVINIHDNDEVVIGFINQPYNVSEDDGMACVEVGVVSGILGRNIAVQLAFSSKSVIYGRDYGNSTGSLVFIFNATHNRSAACVPLIKDDIFELTEVLEATLRLLGQPSSSLVSLVSTSLNITILDDDVLTFSFNQSSYEVSEDAGNATLDVSLSGNLGILVASVSLATDDTSTLASARAESDYMMLPSTNLTFSNGTRSLTFTIAIISDTIPEQVETIVVNITSITISRNGTYIPLSPQEKSRIKILPSYARVIIYDNIHCTHQAPVVHTTCLVVVWEAPSVACGRINGYEIHFFNTITDRVYNGRSSTAFFVSSVVTPSLGPQHATYVQVRVTNGTWSEPLQLCP